MTNYLITAVIMASMVHAVGAHASAPVTRELSFQVPDLTLRGTFERPAGKGPFPALLLLPGSGPTDRDGNSALGITTDLLKDVADALASSGIASYRFDKRAIRIYAPSWPKTASEMNRFFGWRKFVDDARAALDVLAKQPEVDPKRVGLFGHSEGSLISLQIGSDSVGKPDAPRILILAGCTGRPMGEVLHDQISFRLKKAAVPANVYAEYMKYTDSACAALAAGDPPPPNTPQGLVALFNPTVLDIMGAYCRIDPAKLAKRYSGPVMVVNGQNDTQVSAERDTPRILAALKSRSGSVVESLIVPDVSHCLKSTKGGDNDAFGGPVAPGVLDKISQFASSHL